MNTPAIRDNANSGQQPIFLAVSRKSVTRDLLAAILKNNGFAVEAVRTPEEAAERLAAGGFTAALVDMRAETLKTLKLEGNTFTITKGDATLRGTFVTPATVKLNTDDLERMHMGAKRTILYAACAGLFATGGDEYLCVMTIQRGAPPEVRVKGAGLDAVVTVGKRVIRFDGTKIVFSE